jgi:hypothetical protein
LRNSLLLISKPAKPILAVHEVRLLERVVGELRKAEDEGSLDQLDPDVHAEVAAEVQTLESQLRSPKPKRSIVKAALESLRNIAEEAVGGAMGAGVVVAVKMGAEGIL